MSPPPLARRLSSLDAAFLYLETDEAPLQIGGVSVLDGDVTAEAYAARLDARLPEVPRYLQRLASPPFGLGHPVWEPDPTFDVRRHVLETRLDPPGDDGQLQACVSRLFAPRLDRDRPLWEIHVIRGPEGPRTALLSRIHHAMVDGISGVELMNIVFDLAPDTPLPSTVGPVAPAEADHCPIVPLGFETGLNCALLTYDGVLYAGLLADAAAISDLGPLTSHLRSAYKDLRTSTGGGAGTAGDGHVVGRERPGRKERDATGSRSVRPTKRTLRSASSRTRRAARPRSTRKR